MGADAERFSCERDAVVRLFDSWTEGEPPTEHHACQDEFLKHAITRLLPGMAKPDRPKGRLLSAQVSVDTGDPGRLRLTLDPFHGEALGGIAREQVLGVLAGLESEALFGRISRLCDDERELPQNLWIGLARSDHGPVIKAYMSSRRFGAPDALSRIARAAGWLPTQLSAAFCRVYESLAPHLAEVEGCGLAFVGERWVGATLYLRATSLGREAPFDAICDFLEIGPVWIVRRFVEMFGDVPPIFGWAIECDPLGDYLDLKLELKVEHFTGRLLAEFERFAGFDCGPIVRLASLIQKAGLCVRPVTAPAVMSLRFIRGRSRSLVAYFPIEGRRKHDQVFAPRPGVER